MNLSGGWTNVLAMIIVLLSVLLPTSLCISCPPCQCVQRFRHSYFKRSMVYSNCSERGLTSVPTTLPNDLQIIDFSHNAIGPHEIKAFNSYPSLRYLSLDTNQLTLIPKNIFLYMEQLKFLSLKGNRLKEINEQTFNGLTGLRNLQGLEADNISTEAFIALTYMSELHATLHQNILPPNIFNYISPSKVTLHLANAEILPGGIFMFKDKTLVELIIKAPKLIRLSNNMLTGLEILKTFRMYSPNLRSVPENLLKGCRGDAVRSVYNAHCSQAATKLVSIELDSIDIIPAKLFQYQERLESLTLKNVNTIPDSILIDLVTLNSLDLSHSTLNNIPNLNGLSGLKNLHLSFCNLSIVSSETFTGLYSLTSLDLSNNKICSIPVTVFQEVGRTLEHLNLSSNCISEQRPELYKGMLALKYLDLSNNRMHLLHDTQFTSLQQLKKLGLQSNELVSLPNTLLENLENIVHLNLSGNQLETVPASLLSNALTLQVVDLSNNNLKSIPMEIISQLAFMDWASLNGNSISCDCDLYMALRDDTKHAIMGSCATPDYFVGLTLQQLLLEGASRCSTTINISPAERTIAIALAPSPHIQGSDADQHRYSSMTVEDCFVAADNNCILPSSTLQTEFTKFDIHLVVDNYPKTTIFEATVTPIVQHTIRTTAIINITANASMLDDKATHYIMSAIEPTDELSDGITMTKTIPLTDLDVDFVVRTSGQLLDMLLENRTYDSSRLPEFKDTSVMLRVTHVHMPKGSVAKNMSGVGHSANETKKLSIFGKSEIPDELYLSVRGPKRNSTRENGTDTSMKETNDTINMWNQIGFQVGLSFGLTVLAIVIAVGIIKLARNIAYSRSYRVTRL